MPADLDALAAAPLEETVDESEIRHVTGLSPTPRGGNRRVPSRGGRE